MNKVKKFINIKFFVYAVIFSWFTVIALCTNAIIPTEKEILEIFKTNNWFILDLAKLYLSIGNFGIKENLVLIGLLFFYYKGILTFKFDKVNIMVSLIFSFCMVFGLSFHKYDSWDYVFGNHFQVIFAMIQILGWLVLFYFLLDWLFIIVSKYNSTSSLLNSTRFDKKSALIILLCWSPIIIAYLPASFPFDSFRMLTCYMGEVTWTASHPVIPTILLGIIMEFGLKLGSANIGAFICMVIQTVGMLGAFCYLLRFMREISTNKSIYFFSVLYFALCPVWPAYAQDIIKDTINLIFCVFYTVLYLKLVIDPSMIKNFKNILVLTSSMILTCLFRNTGIYLVVLSMIPLIIFCGFKYKERKLIGTLSGTLLVCIIFMFVLNQLIVPAMGIKPGSKGEMLSIPFQQTARYLKEYPGDVTEVEKQVIDNILNYEVLAERYNPNLSDPVKGTIHSQDKKDIINYLNVWIKMFFRHPGVYFEATMNGIYNYFYPEEISKTRSTGLKFYIQSKSAENSSNTGTFDVQYVNNDSIRAGVRLYANNFWRQIPILGLCYNTGVYTWILIICIALLIKYKKYYAILGTIPSILTILFCIASPVNGYVRYMLPAMAVTPLMIAWTLYAIRESLVQKRKRF